MSVERGPVVSCAPTPGTLCLSHEPRNASRDRVQKRLDMPDVEAADCADPEALLLPELAGIDDEAEFAQPRIKLFKAEIIGEIAIGRDDIAAIFRREVCLEAQF